MVTLLPALIWVGEDSEGFPNEQRDIRQNHRVHTQEHQLECTICHPGAENAAKAGMPEMEVCTDCHEEETDDESDEKKGCLKCHVFRKPHPECTVEHCGEDHLPEFEVVMGPKPYRLRYSDMAESGGFSHRTHYEGKVDCSRCHGMVAQDGNIPFLAGRYMPNAHTCYNCHAKALEGFSHKRHCDRDIKCSSCHGDIATAGKGLFPAGNYMPALKKECRKCHQPVSEDCGTCHKPKLADPDGKPASHTSVLDDY